VLELRVPIRMLRALESLAIGLQAVAELLEQPRHHLHARLMPLLLQRRDQVAQNPRPSHEKATNRSKPHDPH
jgi:hypothetical protein